MPPLLNRKIKSKEQKDDIILKGSQVALYVDQRDHVKQKSDNLSSN